MRARMFDHLIGADEVEGINLLKIFGTEPFQIIMVHEFCRAGIIDQNIQPTPFIHRRLDQCFAICIF